MITVGTGPCKTCSTVLDDIPLTRDTLQADGGGTWWRVQDGQTCPHCGQRLDWMYEAAITLDLGRRARTAALHQPKEG